MTYYKMECIAEKIDIKDMSIKLKEAFINTLRYKRNSLLEDTDKYMLPDFPISVENKSLIILYRQQLRDFMNAEYINIDTISDDIMNSFPIKPEFITNIDT